MNNENIKTTMDNLSQLLGYKTSNSSSEAGNHDFNEYQRAAEYLKSCVVEEGIEISTSSEDIEQALETFKNSYSPEILEALSDDELLSTIFYTIGDNTNALCCWLEMNKECRSYFGSIAGYNSLLKSKQFYNAFEAFRYLRFLIP